jgi:asparagine synthase (glutamine-hydrolysing)
MLRRLIGHYGEPYCDSSMLPTALLSKFTRDHVTVALSGDGGDEVFGGYERYRIMALQRFIQFAPEKWRALLCNLVLKALPQAPEDRSALGAVRRLLRAFSETGVSCYATFQEVFSESAKQALFNPVAERPSFHPSLTHWEAILSRGSATDFVEQFMELDLLAYLPSDLLCKVDTASMMFSLEVRCPFMDHELIEFAATLPRRDKVSLAGRKRILKHCARQLVPDRIVNRPKRGFGVPVSAWLRGELRPLALELGDTASWDRDRVFSQAAVTSLVREHLDGARDHGARIWALLCYRLWQEWLAGGDG